MEEAIINIYGMIETCIKHYCKKEYKAYQTVINNYMKQHKNILNIQDSEKQVFLECKLNECKPHVIKLINLLLQDSIKDLKKYQDLLKKETDSKKKKFYKDIIDYNQKQMDILKKINVKHITWKDLQTL